MATADLRLVLLLLLVVGTFLIFATCNDAPVAPNSAGIRPAPGGVPGPNPDRPGGGGGDKGDKGGQVDGNFSLRFDGATTHAITPDADDLDLTTTWTLEAWIKPNNVNTQWGHMVSKWGGGGDASYNIVVYQGRLRCSIHDGVNPSQGLNSFGTLAEDTWQHVAVTLDKGTLRWYINGILDRTFTNSQTPMNSNRPVSLGRSGPPANLRYFDGVMDEVRIWNVARSQKQIEKNKDKEISPRSKGLVAYWKMNEGRGQVLLDETGDGHDMQLGDSPDADSSDPIWALKWESLASLPVAVRASAAETDASHAFVFAGAQNVNDEVNHTQIYDVATNSWSLGTARDPVKAFNMGAAMSDGIHVVGGFNTAHLNNHDVYDPANDTWSTRVALPTGTHAGTAQAVDEKLYVTGVKRKAASYSIVYQ